MLTGQARRLPCVGAENAAFGGKRQNLPPVKDYDGLGTERLEVRNSGIVNWAVMSYIGGRELLDAAGTVGAVHRSGSVVNRLGCESV